ncbi:hypothetical protein ANRL1_04909 [Anaerolineae bacterium]|nr:hypothetical protein ANRL1_04909 [Anaerolineae bacterium]
MSQTIQIDPQLWAAFTSAVAKRRKKPQIILAKLIREYLEIQEDQSLFAGMRHDLHGRTMTDDEIVEFVHQYRREKRSARVVRKP